MRIFLFSKRSAIVRVFFIQMSNLLNHWFAIRITYGRELLLKELLDGAGIENFIPMRYDYVQKSGRKLRKLVPVIHNLVFVRSTRSKIDELKVSYSIKLPMRYVMNRTSRQPIIIPDAQMHSFILVSSTHDEAVLYLEPAELALVKGQKVRITDGVFRGVIGEFIRIRHDRRVVVRLEGVMAIATTFVHSSLVEKLDTETH